MDNEQIPKGKNKKAKLIAAVVILLFTASAALANILVQTKPAEQNKTNDRSQQVPGEKTSHWTLQKQVASLRTENSRLRQTIEELERTLNWEKQLRKDAETELNALPFNIDDLLQKSKNLHAYNISILTSKLSSKFAVDPSDKAAKISSIFIGFTLIENAFAEKGEKQISVKLGTAPSIIAHKAILYNGSDTQENIVLDINQKLSAGEYTVRIYNDTILAGSKTFILK
ncbi:MAG TPA: hypothetical protein VJY62_00130 [Bacteroidia bacterium]|nr:hypothetical protein [Bacteroidia bacterium]